jgi:acyl-CoA thioesterase-1
MSKQQSMRIAFFGDSIVNGTGDGEMLGWPGRICASASARGHDITCYNLGIRRDRSIEIAARWRDEASKRLPPGIDARVVFSCGINDAMLLQGPAPASETLAAMRAILAFRGERPMLFIGPAPINDPQMNQRIRQIDAAMLELCNRVEVSFFSIFEQLHADALWMKALELGDGAHPDAAGYRRYAELIDSWTPWRAWLP